MLHTLSDAIGSQVPLYGAGDTGGGGGGGPTVDIYEAAIVVGNALAGDTLLNCHYLDPGNGTGIVAALAAALALAPLRVKVYIRRGSYTINPALVALPMTIPSNVVLQGDDRRTVTLTSGNGAGATVQDLFAMAAGSVLLDMTMVVPAPVAGVAAGNAIVDFQNDCRLERLDLTINEVAVAAATYVGVGYSRAAPASGTYLSDVAVRYARGPGPTGGFFAVMLYSTDGTHVEPARRNILDRVTTTDSRGDGLVQGIYSTNPAVDITDVVCVRTGGVAVSVVPLVSGAVAGPTIDGVLCDLRGQPAPTLGFGASIQAQFTVAGTNVLRGARLTNVQVVGDANAGGGVSYAAAIRGYGGLGTIDGPVIQGVGVSGGIAGSFNVLLESDANCTIRGATVTGCALGEHDILVDSASGAGVVTGATIVGNACRDVTLINARTARNTVVGNRITGVYTDGGTDTQAGLNNIG